LLWEDSRGLRKRVLRFRLDRRAGRRSSRRPTSGRGNWKTPAPATREDILSINLKNKKQKYIFIEAYTFEISSKIKCK